MDGMDEVRLGRRALLASGAALVVHFAAGGTPVMAAAAAGGRPALVPDELDSFIAIARDGMVTAFYGKMDPGQGVDVAIGQIVADELDVPYASVRVVQGDTTQTVNQGGASGSTGIELGGRTLRYAAAEARRVLVERAAAKLGAPAGGLATADGAVFVAAEPARRVTYAALLDGAPFEARLDWNRKIGNELFSRGAAEPKAPATYKVVGQSVPRQDLRHNAFGRQVFVGDIRLPGMLHARMIRPPVAGAEPVQVDEGSIRDIPGARVVREKALLAVVAEKEWNAIRAAEALDVTWSQPAPAFPEYARLHEHIRAAPVVQRDEVVKQGDLAAAMQGSRLVAAEYAWPFQSHSSMAGGCAVVDVRPEGVRVWSGTQKPHFARDGVAHMLGLKPEQVQVQWTRGPGSYGRNDAGDAVMDAAVLSRATGRPVRVQYTRAQGTGWDPKGPASVHRCEAALGADGRIAGYSFVSKGFSRVDTDTNESDPRDTLAGQMMGMGQKPGQGFGVPTEPYDIPARLLAWETIAPLLANASPLRTSHLRDPVGPQINFASESFIDELAAAAGADPVEFRLRHLKAARAIAVVKAAAEAFGWTSRAAATGPAMGGDVARGRGIALAQRGQTIVAAITEIELDRRSFAVRPVRWAVAHDCGLIINPATLKRTIEGNIIHATSRALMEEVTFSPRNVTAVDWASYPILDMKQTPERIDIVLVNRPDQPAVGAGEASTRPVAAAIANAIFDATGTRLRQVPFTPQRVKASLA